MKKIIGGIAVVGVVIVVLLIVAPLLFGPSMAASMTVTLYDESGNPIEVGGVAPAFIDPKTGTVLSDSLDVTVAWTLSSAGEMTQPFARGTVLVVCYLNTPTAGETGRSSGPMEGSGETNSVVTSFSLSALIGTPTESGKTYGWRIVITADLEGAAYVDGDPAGTTWSDSITIAIGWGEAGLTLEGVIST